MAISRNQLLIGGAIAGVLAILFFRVRAKRKQNLLDTAVTKNPIADDGMPSLPTDDEPTPLPTTTSPNDPKTGGVKVIKPDLPPKNQGVNTVKPFETENERGIRLILERKERERLEALRLEAERKERERIARERFLISQAKINGGGVLPNGTILQNDTGSNTGVVMFDPLENLVRGSGTVSSGTGLRADIFTGDTFGIVADSNSLNSIIY